MTALDTLAPLRAATELTEAQAQMTGGYYAGYADAKREIRAIIDALDRDNRTDVHWRDEPEQNP